MILSFISSWYTYFAANAVIAAVLKGMQSGAAALIVDLVIDMTNMIIKERSPFLTLMIPASFCRRIYFSYQVAVILGFAVSCACSAFLQKSISPAVGPQERLIYESAAKPFHRFL